MALQWVMLTYVVAAETAIVLLLTLPYPKVLQSRIVSHISLILQPCMFIIPFAGFQLLDLYWKNEHRLQCSSEVCTATVRDRYEKSVHHGGAGITTAGLKEAVQSKQSNRGSSDQLQLGLVGGGFNRKIGDFKDGDCSIL